MTPEQVRSTAATQHNISTPTETSGPFPKNSALNTALTELRAVNTEPPPSMFKRAMIRIGWAQAAPSAAELTQLHVATAHSAAQAQHGHALMAHGVRTKQENTGKDIDAVCNTALKAAGQKELTIDAFKKVAALSDNDSGKAHVINLLKSHTPEDLVAEFKTRFAKAGLSDSDADLMAKLSYAALVSAYPSARADKAEQAEKDLTKKIATAETGINAALAGSRPLETHRAKLDALRKEVVDDIHMSFAQRNKLYDTLKPLTLQVASNSERIAISISARDAILARMPRAQPPAGLTPAARLQFFKTEAEALGTVTEVLAKAVKNKELTPAHQAQLERDIEQFRSGQPGRIKDALLDAFKGDTRIRTALEQAAKDGYKVQVDGKSVNVLDVLLKLSVLTLDFTPKTLERFLPILGNELAKPDAWSNIVRMSEGDAKAIDALLPEAKWDEVRWAMLFEFTPKNIDGNDEARQKLVDTRFALSVVTRELSKEIAGFDFTQTPTASSMQALVEQAKKAGGVDAVNLKLANWMMLSIETQGKPNEAEIVQFLGILGIQVNLETVQRCIAQGFSNTAHLYKVESQLALLSEHLGKNRAISASGASKAAEAARLVALEEAFGMRVGATSARSALPTETERVADSDRAELQAAEKLVDRTHQKAQMLAQRESLVALLKKDKPGVDWSNIRPEQFDNAHTVMSILAAEEGLQREKTDKNFSAAGAILKDRNTLLGKLGDLGDASPERTRRPSYIKRLFDWFGKLDKFNPATMGNDAGKPDLNLTHDQRIKQLRTDAEFPAQILLDIQALDKGIGALDKEISSEKSKLDKINQDKAKRPTPATTQASKGADESVLGRMRALLAESSTPGPERLALQEMIALATIEVCKETIDPATDAPIEPAAFVPSDHRAALIQKLKERGLDANRILAGSPERVRLFLADIDTKVPLSKLSAKWAKEQTDFATHARIYMSTVLNRSVGQLRAEEFFNFEFGTEGVFSVSMPEAAAAAMSGGVGLAIQTRMASANSVRVECLSENNGNRQFAVTIMAGKEGAVTARIAALLGALEVGVGAQRSNMEGCRLNFSSEAACQKFLTALAKGQPGEAAQEAAKAGEVALVTRNGMVLRAQATAQLPNPVRLFTAGAIPGESGIVIKTDATVAATTTWQTTTTARGNEFTRSRTMQALASTTVAVSTGSDTIDAAGAALVDALSAKADSATNTSKASEVAARAGDALNQAGARLSRTTGTEVSETTLLVVKHGSLTAESQIELSAVVTAGNALRAWESVAGAVSSHNEQFNSKAREWIAKAGDGTSFRVIRRPSAQAVRDYNWELAEAAGLEKTNPTAHAQALAKANAKLAEAMRPIRVELRAARTQEDSTGTAAIENAAVRKVASAGPVTLRDTAKSTTEVVLDSMQIA